MHPAIELILARMESNPEEFSTGTSRWYKILHRLSEFAQKDEWKEVLAKWDEIRMHNVHREIMQELCVPTEQPEQKRLFEGKWVDVKIEDAFNRDSSIEKLKKVSSRSV